MSEGIPRLLALDKLGIKFGLENIRALCAALHHPELTYPAIIVAGTNGKGSVSAMVDAALGSAGYRSGLYTSPHLARLEERFVVGRQEIETSELERVTKHVLAVIDDLVARGTLTAAPTFFEATTAIAFELFRLSSIDLAVLEVGMGGRLDATNIASPLAAAITTIALDHERFLGTTLPQIAFEKAGVIKPGMPVVLGDPNPEVAEVVSRVCAERGATLVLASDAVETTSRRVDDDLEITVRTRNATYGPLVLALKGRHQIDNAITAIRLLEELRDKGFSIPHEAIEYALTHTVWKGRLDVRRFPDGRSVLFDAAHNPAGARALAGFLAETNRRLPLVFGVMRDKNAVGMLEELLPQVAGLVATEPGNPRALPASELAAVARRVSAALPIDVEPDPQRALARAWTRGPHLLVTGSIFLVGALLERVAPSD